MAEHLTLCLNLDGAQLSQWANFNFNSMAKIGDSYVGAGDDGLMQLNTGPSDNGTPIEAFLELVLSDWGISHQKRVRSFYIGFETDGELLLTARDDEGRERNWLIAPEATANQQHGSKVNGARDGKGRYWSIRIDNVNGSDFSIDHVQVLPVILNRHP